MKITIEKEFKNAKEAKEWLLRANLVSSRADAKRVKLNQLKE